MLSFRSPSKRLYKSRTARFDEQFNWPATALEEIIGIPDILNEKLADNIVRETQKKVKSYEVNKQFHGIHAGDSDIESDHRSLVGRAHFKVFRKTVF